MFQPIRSEGIGSLLRPQYLKDAGQRLERGDISPADFKHIEDRAVEEAVVPLERLAISPQCGFASTSEGNRLLPSDQRQKLEVVTAVAPAPARVEARPGFAQTRRTRS